MGASQRPVGGAELQRQARSNRRLLWLSIALLGFLGTPCTLLAFGMKASPNPGDDPDAWWIVLVMTLVFFDVPGMITTWIYRGRSRRTGRFEKLVALAKAVPRLPFDDVAGELRCTLPVARDLIVEAISKGLVAGRLDLEQGLFLSAEANTAVHEVAARCPNCGAEVKVLQVPGEVPSCPYCQKPLPTAA